MEVDIKGRLKLFFETLRNGETKKVMFLRFMFVGCINTVHNYIWYILFLTLKVPYMISFTLAFIIAMIGSFFLNCYFTFKTRPTLIKFIKFPLTTLFNYCFSSLSLYILVSIFTVPKYIAGPMASIIPIPVTFLITKLLLSK